MRRLVIVACLGLSVVTGRTEAAGPLVTLTPTTPVALELVPGSTATVQYMVANQSAVPRTWSMTPMEGVTQVTSGATVCSDPIVLAAKGEPDSSCLLVLEIVTDEIPPAGVHGGPVVCMEPIQCYQPSAADSLSIDLASVPCEGDGDCPSQQYCRVDQCATQRPLGEPCAAQNECSSGYCADAVCCDIPCAGGTHDCQACSITAGAAVDGTCAAVADSTVCDDGDGCTLGEACAAGVCSGADDACHDETSCTSAGPSSFECGACPPGTYSIDGTGATDCTPCEPGTFASTAGAVECTPFSVCGPEEFEIGAGSATSDRTCAPADPGPNGGAPDGGVTQFPSRDGGMAPEATGGNPGGGGCRVSSSAAHGPASVVWLLVSSLALARRRPTSPGPAEHRVPRGHGTQDRDPHRGLERTCAPGRRPVGLRARIRHRKGRAMLGFFRPLVAPDRRAWLRWKRRCRCRLQVLSYGSVGSNMGGKPRRKPASIDQQLQRWAKVKVRIEALEDELAELKREEQREWRAIEKLRAPHVAPGATIARANGGGASLLFRRWVERERAKGKTNEELAKSLGISSPTFYEYMKGSGSKPQTRPRKAIAKVTGIGVELPW